MKRGAATALAVATSTAATLVLLLVAEVGVRLADVQPQSWPAIDGTTFFDGVQVDPLLGPLPRAGWSGLWFDMFGAEIDARGFRSTGAAPVAGARASVAFVGDSCTFGWGVATPDTFVAGLDARQRGAGAQLALINAAYPGQSAVVGGAILRERVLPLQPDVVVIGYSANNAFRFSAVSDRQRFRFFALRKLMLRSRLLHVAAAWLANRNAPRRDPKERETLRQRDAHALERVASAADFAAALRAMTATASARGAAVMLLLFPRASLVSTQFAYEDPARPPRLAPRDTSAAVTRRELGVLEASCLEPTELADPVQALHEQRPRWHPVYPSDPALRDLLRRGAQAYARSAHTEALRLFAEAAAQHPDSPLAAYDHGVARLTAGDDGGLAELERADGLACNVFLRYLVTAWRVARELRLPVVDLALHFQAHEGAPLFLDPAHPTVEGHRLIADALWPTVTRVVKAK